MFGTERALQEGREGPDFISGWVIGQVKSREKFPKWLMDPMQKVRDFAKYTGKLPILCLVEKGRRGFLVVIDSRDFEDFFGYVCHEPDDLTGLDSFEEKYD